MVPFLAAYIGYSIAERSALAPCAIGAWVGNSFGAGFFGALIAGIIGGIVAFTDKLYAADSRLVVAKNSDIQPTVESLKGKRVGVLQGTTQETFGNEHWAPKGIEIVSYQGQDNIYSDLTAGRIDAAFQDEVAASEGFLKQPVGKDYKFGGPSVKDEKLFGVGTGMGLRKEDNELREALNKAFAEMRADGTYEKLAKKYFDFDVYGG